ncbi:uncharacterized protein LOC108864619 [Galendromus occidentalis]|uniref:Uncharacterized protein LOC108864619 n=1 Tax=Galendromus occidentalis TaxID=34638 RepID=A0AAJ7SGF3_9ACAR|nr:uncharacterized protein LOC108864619 [Galendromus occidentalis]
MTEANLSEIALDPTNILQIGFVNPAQYYFEFYLNTDITQVSYSILPSHMCYTMNWRTDTKMEAVHQNIIAFEMNMMVSWPDDEHIQTSPYELTLGFHYVDTNTAGQRHAIVLRPSGDYVFGVIQEGTRTLPPPYDTMCRNYTETLTFDDGYTVKSSRDMCNEDCKMQVVLRVCGCLMSNYIYRNKISGNVCDANATENCVQAHAREMYTKICPTECPAACREDTYKATQSIWRQIGSDDNDLKYVNVKVIVTSRQVDVLHFVPLLTSTQILGIIGGYIGFWMGLSFYKVGALCARKVQVNAYQMFSILTIMHYLVVHKSFKTCLLLSTIIACSVSCIREFHEYRRYPTTVYYSQDSIDRAAFPATTVCLLDGINYSDICSTYLGENCANREPNFESMVGNDIVLMKFIINFTYLAEEVVSDCTMESRSDLCESFDCTDLWNRTFTYVKTGSCYTLDMTTLPDHTFWKCKEQFKYNLKFKVRSFGAKVGGGATMTALVHEQNRYTSGIIHSFRFEPGRKYYLTVAQSHLVSLPKPYESGCVDYEKDGSNERLYQRYIIQEEECCEACVAATWIKHCGCFSKMYAVKHKMTENVCDYVTHLKCIDRMIQHKWSVGCQGRCTQGCNDKRYRGLMHQIGYLNTPEGIPSSDQCEIRVFLGSTSVKRVTNLAKIKLSDFILYLSGHITMWLDVSIMGSAPDTILSMMRHFQNTLFSI